MNGSLLHIFLLSALSILLKIPNSSSFAHAGCNAKNTKELINCLKTITPGETILLNDGVCKTKNYWAFQVLTPDTTIRSASGNRDRVVIQGNGMFAKKHHGFFIDADNVTISNISNLRTSGTMQSSLHQEDLALNYLSQFCVTQVSNSSKERKVKKKAFQRTV